MIPDPFPGGLLPRTANQKERDMSETNTEVVHDARHLPDDVGVLQDKVVELTTELVMYRKLASASTEEEAQLFMQEVHFLAVLAAAGFSGDDVKDVVVPAAFGGTT